MSLGVPPAPAGLALLDAGLGYLVCLGWDRFLSIPVPHKCCF